MKIGILETGRLESALQAEYGDFPFQFARMLEGHGFSFRAYAVLDGEMPTHVGECDGWLITGSRHAAYDELDWIKSLEVFIRDAYDKNIPTVGICFGHQVMATALGGKVIKYPGGWGMGKNEYNRADGSGPLNLLAMHQDQVVEIPPQAQVTASSEFCEFAALAYRGNAISYQAHPEFTTEFISDLIDSKVELGLDESVGIKAKATLDNEHDSADIAVEIAHFFLSSAKANAAQ